MALAVAPEGYRSGSRSPRGKSDAAIHVGLDGCAANPEEVLRGGFTEEMNEDAARLPGTVHEAATGLCFHFFCICLSPFIFHPYKNE